MNYPLPLEQPLSDTEWKIVYEIGHTDDFILQEIYFKDL